MTIKPITFSGPMVRALLAGTKTQTRRLSAWANNSQLTYIIACDKPGWFGNEEGEVQFKVPYVPGDRVYVREGWYAAHSADDVSPRDMDSTWKICPAVDWNYADWGIKGRYRQAMHMPRWASRIWLGITDVRVQRLQAISESDCIAEGIERDPDYPNLWKRGPLKGDQNNVNVTAFPKLACRSIWEALHTEPGTTWADNPWIVAYTFTVHAGNVDT